MLTQHASILGQFPVCATTEADVRVDLPMDCTSSNFQSGPQCNRTATNRKPVKCQKTHQGKRINNIDKSRIEQLTSAPINELDEIIVF